jgi:hypothetical protein
VDEIAWHYPDPVDLHLERHAWTITMDAADAKATFGIEIGRTTLVTMGVTAILSAFLTIMPETFLLGSVMGGGVVYFIAAMQCRQHNLRGALIEIPFLLLPFVLLWVGHPIGRDCQGM